MPGEGVRLTRDASRSIARLKSEVKCMTRAYGLKCLVVAVPSGRAYRRTISRVSSGTYVRATLCLPGYLRLDKTIGGLIECRYPGKTPYRQRCSRQQGCPDQRWRRVHHPGEPTQIGMQMQSMSRVQSPPAGTGRQRDPVQLWLGPAAGLPYVPAKHAERCQGDCRRDDDDDDVRHVQLALDLTAR
jgi:hypothetical protein